MTNTIGKALERLFKLSENKTTIRTEIAAGLTTFLTMAYIIFVNPQILSEAGVPFSGALFASASTAVIVAAIPFFILQRSYVRVVAVQADR